MTTLHAIFHGHVQGVFFRAAAKEHAVAHQLSGTAENLRDGSVEIYVTGKRDDLENFIESVKEEPGSGRVSHIDLHYLDKEIHFEGFKVVHHH